MHRLQEGDLGGKKSHQYRIMPLDPCRCLLLTGRFIPRPNDRDSTQLSAECAASGSTESHRLFDTADPRGLREIASRAPLMNQPWNPRSLPRAAVHGELARCVKIGVVSSSASAYVAVRPASAFVRRRQEEVGSRGRNSPDAGPFAPNWREFYGKARNFAAILKLKYIGKRLAAGANAWL